MTGASPTSNGGIIALIVVVAVVAVVGVSTATLFYLTKKREWRLRDGIKRSAKKLATAFTPRRSQFPRSVRGSLKPSRASRVRFDEIPPTPRLTPEDLEKGYAKHNIRQSPGAESGQGSSTGKP